mmetsp:Transcript_90860/g.196603  ORF Transcript_90860/g.196603 Transcript_90860/m.196603 type:complete len:316 (-) Transcript_90860:55-1002(-)
MLRGWPFGDGSTVGDTAATGGQALERGEGARVVNIYTRASSTSSCTATTAAFATTLASTTTATTTAFSSAFTAGALLAGGFGGLCLESDVQYEGSLGCTLLLLGLVSLLVTANGRELRTSNDIFLGLHASKVGLNLADLHLSKELRVGSGGVAGGHVLIKSVGGHLGLRLGHVDLFSVLVDNLLTVVMVLFGILGIVLRVTPVTSAGTSLANLLATAGAAMAIVFTLAGFTLASSSSSTSSAAATTTGTTAASLLASHRNILILGSGGSSLGDTTTLGFLVASSLRVCLRLGVSGDLRGVLVITITEKCEHVTHD